MLKPTTSKMAASHSQNTFQEETAGRPRGMYLNRTNRGRGRTQSYGCVSRLRSSQGGAGKALTLMLQVSPGREKELTLLGEKAGPPRWPPVFPSCISETLNWDLRGLLLKFVYLRMTWK